GVPTVRVAVEGAVGGARDVVLARCAHDMVTTVRAVVACAGAPIPGPLDGDGVAVFEVHTNSLRRWRRAGSDALPSVTLPQVGLANLAARGARELVDEDHVLRHLVARNAPLQIVAHGLLAQLPARPHAHDRPRH